MKHNPYNLPTRFELCPTCEGRGTSSAYLGAFTAEEMREDPDFAEDYFAGRYDRSCDECGGKRVVEVVDRDRSRPDTLAEHDAYMDEVYFDDEIQRQERAMGA